MVIDADQDIDHKVSNRRIIVAFDDIRSNNPSRDLAGAKHGTPMCMQGRYLNQVPDAPSESDTLTPG
jgi:hypothetical protein